MIDDSQFDNTQPGVCRVYLCGRKAKTFFEVQVIPKITDQSGDANGDGSRTIGDAILMARVLAEDTAAVLSDQGKQRADLDGVNALTANDLTLILQILAGMIG
jgi:hypothetical protein